MNLTIDIEGKSNRILGELNSGFISMKLFDFPLFLPIEFFFLKRKVNKLFKKVIKLMDDFILSLEGFQGHIAELEVEEANKLIIAIRKSISDFDDLDEAIAGLSQFTPPEFRKKIDIF